MLTVEPLSTLLAAYWTVKLLFTIFIIIISEWPLLPLNSANIVGV